MASDDSAQAEVRTGKTGFSPLSECVPHSQAEPSIFLPAHLGIARVSSARGHRNRTANVNGLGSPARAVPSGLRPSLLWVWVCL